MQKILFFIAAIYFGCTSCNTSGSELPESIIGSWQNTIQIEGTDGEVEVSAEISGDTILVRQTFPRMSGIDKIKTSYPADHIRKVSETSYDFFTTQNNQPSRISLQLLKNGDLSMSICQSGPGENEDVEYSMCTEWGVFGRIED